MSERDWAVELARTASQKVGIYPGDRYYARDHDKFVYVIARLLRKAERRGYRRGVKVLAMALTGRGAGKRKGECEQAQIQV